MGTLRRLRRVWLSALITVLVVLVGATPSAAHKPTDRPDRVVVIVVDALSRELVEKYGMTNVQALMRDGVDTPNGYLGHLGSVTVVTHNVITAGLLPKNMGWTSEGYRDSEGVLTGQAGGKGPYWISSDWGKDQIFAVQKHYGYPKLADYLHKARPGSRVVTISPKTYAAYAFGGPGSDSIVTFSGKNYDCLGKGDADGVGDGVNDSRGPAGVNVPVYLAKECGRYFVHPEPDADFDTEQSPARMYPATDTRYVPGRDEDHLGGDVWAADAAIDTITQEKDWSGVFVTLPGVDKAAHMWGGVIDKEGAGLDPYDPMTHITAATKLADQQVGRIIDTLRSTGQLDNTLVVLTADHGAVPGTNFYGTDDGRADRGTYNWYYGDVANGKYLEPQPVLQPLVATGNVAMTYSDSMVSAWLKDASAAKQREAARIMAKMPKVSSVWIREGSHFEQFGPVRWGWMKTRGEREWFADHAQELVDTAAAPYGADVIATLVDDTTYSVAGDHGGIQRRAQQIPIVFAGAGLSSQDLPDSVRSVDIMPTVLRELGIKPTKKMDGIGYELPNR